MYRLQYRAVCSRETDRLPVADIQRKLGSKVPNVENGHAASETPTDSRFILYLGDQREFGLTVDEGPFYHNYFMLVEVDGSVEHVLDRGAACGLIGRMAFNGRSYAKFEAKGDKTGRCMYYCTPPESK